MATHTHKVKVPTLSQARPPAADLDVNALVLTGPKQARHRRLSANIRNAVTQITLQQTKDGASTLTLTVNDWSEALMKSQLITGALTLGFDGVDYTLTKVARQDVSMTLTFEETAVAVLRTFSKSMTSDRANTTRAQFVRRMVQEAASKVRIPFQCPEVNVRQPVAKPTAASVRAARVWHL